MSKTPNSVQKNLVVRAFTQFGDKVVAGTLRAKKWRIKASKFIEEIDDNRLTFSYLVVVAAVFFGLQAKTFEWTYGLLNEAPVFVFGLPMLACLVLLVFFSLRGIVVGVVKSVLQIAFLVLVAICWMTMVLWYGIGVVSQLLLLVPFFVLVVGSRFSQRCRGIFHTCPVRQCGYRGLSAYVCRECGTVVRDLWPNLYGLWTHGCPNCPAALPTMDILGRNKLPRRCGGCGIPLMKKHQRRERLVAVVGAPGSGKSCLLLMAVNGVLRGHGNGDIQISGQISDRNQREVYEWEWRNIEQGQPPAKTAEVASAFLMDVQVGSSKCMLYLYDAPGEEFESLSGMTKQSYFHLLEGIILLIDPMSLSLDNRAQATNDDPSPFERAVDAMLGTALSAGIVDRQGRISLRVAVVITKADLEAARHQLGSSDCRNITSSACRRAIASWTSQGTLRAIENRVKSVEYFACSALGREANAKASRPFSASGVLDPLIWILTGRRADEQGQ